ncbi:MAG TPA: UTP--glucose-1-phosphate uridylyltransferase, partial [Polyangiaceae bacterium LLY-WYZ-15_(1-7)]|nr:UTP--glucose-1-phosphate uridylyltransferase [Polyangiaceae bacterium LLY-WYZ-15_(1-7)]
QKGVADGAFAASKNLVDAPLQAPPAAELSDMPASGTTEHAELRALGMDAIARGELAVCVLNGGMATRFGGVVKAGVEAVDGKTFMELKVRDILTAAEEAGGRVPLFPMTSFATDAEVTMLSAPLANEHVPIETFPQLISLRLTPEGELFRDEAGELSPYAPGHGDLTFALRKAGILERFRAAGGRVLVMSNVDNLTATLDPAIIGAHLQGGKPMTAEMAPKLPGDKGGAPARVDGEPQIVEAFRFPADFDQDSIPVFNTNTLLFDAEAIDRDFDLTWFAVTKQVGGKPAIQFEHLVGELSAFLPSTFLRVEREGADARFQPVKDPAELERRQDEIRTALEARGIL